MSDADTLRERLRVLVAEARAGGTLDALAPDLQAALDELDGKRPGPARAEAVPGVPME